MGPHVLGKYMERIYNEETLKNVDAVRKVYVPLLLICCPSVMTN